MPKTDDVRLRHMLDAARKTIAFPQSRTRTDLDHDEMLALALIRLIEILGELKTSHKSPLLFPLSLKRSLEKHYRLEVFLRG